MRMLGLLALACGAASTQGFSPMFSAVSQSMHRVCTVNQDSRQCEVLQELLADQLAIEQGRAPELKPAQSSAEKAEMRKALRQAAAEDQAKKR